MAGSRTILLKLSGQALAGPEPYGVHPPTLQAIAGEIGALHEAGHRIGIVVGAGNIFRGMAAAARGMDRVTGDHIGMLGTVMNGLALRGALEDHAVDARVLSAIPVPQFCDSFARHLALEHLRARRVLVLAGGTGNPFFTTDSAAALRAAEIDADVLLKATRVDGVYDRDPEVYPDAVRRTRLTYQEVLEPDLRVMDAAAIAVCREAAIPIVVFDLHQPGNLWRAAAGEDVGTTIAKTEEPS